LPSTEDDVRVLRRLRRCRDGVVGPVRGGAAPERIDRLVVDLQQGEAAQAFRAIDHVVGLPAVRAELLPYALLLARDHP
jgi:hypothetical protein